ncbi:dethiobiotin synthase (plasmid) [Haladaptatus sp. SPP-AMP-3]|uniref:dethiobiotin synthase n=1 Tax=Haladaptatus sp. SPP-AMP-3 TaxID=3121295 RepID=UPI003C2C2B5D
MTDATDVFAVVGTGTGVGKTVITAGLVGGLREHGADARAIKPVQTGYPPDDDAAYVRATCDESRAAACLERLEPPLAPAVAADREDVDLSYDDIEADCERSLADAEVGVLEGIGGLRVPLAEGKEVIDLVAALDLPVVLVARSGLGTLNHTALSIEALERRDIEVLGVVLNEYAGETMAERTNPTALRGMTDRPIHTVPPLSLDAPVDALAVADHLDALMARLTGHEKSPT